MNDRRSDPPVGPAGPVTADDDAGPRAIRHLSHDIRAAMSDVIGGLRLVDARRLDPQTQTQFDRVRAAADTLASLVDHALFAASGESPVAQDTGPVVLEPWLAALSHRWRGQAAEQGRNFTIRRTGTLPERLSVPPVALTRVVGNLVGNALRHVPRGDVEVVIHGGAGGGLAIGVQDWGEGFPPEILRMMAAGAPGDVATSGLGLKIAGDLSRAFGAKLHLENLPTGASATLWLGPHLIAKAEPPQPTRPKPDLSGLRLLVAEDNQTNQIILRHLLEAVGGAADFVSDGRAALRALTGSTYDLALLDIEMPELSGLEVMEKIRAMDAPVAAMPLVAITAYVLRDNREAIYAAGADGIIGKPVASAEDLGHAILRHVGNAAPEPIPSDLPEYRDEVMDHGRMDDLLRAAGPDGRVELLDRLKEDLEVTLAAMDQAVATEDTDELRAQTHILIAISGAVGADRLCHNTEALNIMAKRRSVERFGALVPQIRSDIAALIEEVVRRRAEDGVTG